MKLNISDKGKAWRIELKDENLHGKSIGDTVKGNEISADLEGYELEITGGSDNAGFPLSKDIEGLVLRRKLLTKGFGMRDNTEGLRKRKTLRGKQISATTSQLNLKVLKHGHKKLNDIFPDQNKPVEAAPAPAAA